MFLLQIKGLEPLILPIHTDEEQNYYTIIN